MSGWDKAKEASKKAGDGKYIRLKDDGDKVVGVFLDEPEARSTYFDEKEKKSYVYTDEHRKSGCKESISFLFNFYDVNASRVRVLEVKNATFKDILKVREKYGLEKWAFEIQRNGAKGDNKTTYTVLPETKISELADGVQKAIKEAKLYDLVKEAAGEGGDDDDAKGSRSGGSSGSSSDEPVDDKTRGDIVERLKALPREKADEFLKKFGIGKVKELPQSKAKAALEFLKTLEGASSSDDEEDPFA
jgi:hypothetical protein